MAGVSYNVNDDLINGYISDLESILTDLSNAKTAISEDFPAAYQDFMQSSVKSMYGTEEKVQQIEALSDSITKYRNWIQEVLEECHNDDAARAGQYQDQGISTNTDTGGSTTGNGNDVSSPKTPEQKNVSTEGLSTPTTQQITAPTVSATGAIGNGNNGTSGISGGSQIDIGNSGNGNDKTSSITGGVQSGNSKTGGGILNPLGTDSNYGTSGHSVGGTLANSYLNGGSSSGNRSSGSGLYGANLNGSTGLANGKDGKGLYGANLNGSTGLANGKDGKGLLDNFSELTSGVSLGNMIGNGNGIGSGSIFSLQNNGGTGSNILGTVAKAGVAIGAAGAGIGIATAAHEKYYVFDQEDWLALLPSYRDNILHKYSEVKMSDKQIELFENSTFKIKSDILDDPAKQLEKVIKTVPEIRQQIVQKYRFDIFNDKGRIDRYLLFILMIIDGQSSISEYNYTTMISEYVDDIDTAYGGLQMEDYIYDFEEEKEIREQIEGY